MADYQRHGDMPTSIPRHGRGSSGGGGRNRVRLGCLCAAAAWAVGSAEEVLTAGQPYCRKSPELHTMRWPSPDGKHDGNDRLVIFGGKGFVWKVTKKGKGSKKDHEEELDKAELHHKRSLIDRLIDERAIRPKVAMFGDTWSFDVVTGAWSRIWYEDDPMPTARWKPSTVVANDGHTMILFGGCKTTAASGVMNDLWTFTTASERPRRGIWTQVFTTNPPPARRGHITQANSTHLIIVGGKGWSDDFGSVVLHDVWAIPLAWLGVGTSSPDLAAVSTAAAGPASRTAASAAELRRGGGVPVPLWTQGQDFPGSPRWGATGTVLSYRSGRQVLGFFGGRHLNDDAGFHSTSQSAYTYYNELWLYDFEADSWSLVKPEGGVAPCRRDHHGAAAVRGDLYVFAGRVKELRTADAVLNDLWSFNLDTRTWTEHRPAHGSPAPWPRYMPGVSASQWKGKDVPTIFGGETLPGSTKQTSRNDVWMFIEEDGQHVWKKMFSSDCLPSAVEFSNLPIQFSEEEFEGFTTEAEIKSLRSSLAAAAASAAALAALAAVLGERVWLRRRRLRGAGAGGAAAEKDDAQECSPAAEYHLFA